MFYGKLVIYLHISPNCLIKLCQLDIPVIALLALGLQINLVSRFLVFLLWFSTTQHFICNVHKFIILLSVTFLLAIALLCFHAGIRTNLHLHFRLIIYKRKCQSYIHIEPHTLEGPAVLTPGLQRCL